jgi:hypothetical protein
LGSDLPALIITFRRLDGVQRLMKSLQEAGVVRFFLTIDGPRTSKDIEIQDAIENWATEFANEFNLEFSFLRRKSNLGVKRGILDSLDWFFSQIDFGLVLEDDLEISKDLVEFIRQCRDEFRLNENLWMISGDQFFPEDFQGSQLATCNYPLVWGWATWANKWHEMRASIEQQQGYRFRYLFSSVNSFWWTGTKRVEQGLVDTWDIPLAFAMRQKGKLTVSPPVNLVRNLGFDQFASHTTRNLFPMNLPVSSFQSLLYKVPVIDCNHSPLLLNKKLEKQVFKIKLWHLLSPVKLFVQNFFRR